jgi:hypothetical protein
MSAARNLPHDARERLSELEQVCPEAAAILARIYPDDTKDKAARDRAEAKRQAELRQQEETRMELCRRCRDGDFGKDVEGAAKQVLSETGGEFTSMAVNRILMALKRARIEGRAERPKGKDGAR